MMVSISYYKFKVKSHTMQNRVQYDYDTHLNRVAMTYSSALVLIQIRHCNTLKMSVVVIYYILLYVFLLILRLYTKYSASWPVT